MFSFVLVQICGLEFDRKDINMNKLGVTTLEAKILVYDMRTQHPQKGFSFVSEKVMNLWGYFILSLCIFGCKELNVNKFIISWCLKQTENTFL